MGDGGDVSRTDDLMRAILAGDEAAAIGIARGIPDPGAAGASGETPLIRAAGNRMPGVAAVLLERGADPNHPSPLDGQTALHRAACADDAECAMLLIAAGADVGLPDLRGATPLMAAAANPLAGERIVDVLAGAESPLPVVVPETMGEGPCLAAGRLAGIMRAEAEARAIAEAAGGAREGRGRRI